MKTAQQLAEEIPDRIWLQMSGSDKQLVITTLTTRDKEHEAWYAVILECEKLFRCPDSAESVRMSNLPNLIRDLQSKLAQLEDRLADAQNHERDAQKGSRINADINRSLGARVNELQAENERLKREAAPEVATDESQEPLCAHPGCGKPEREHYKGYCFPADSSPRTELRFLAPAVPQPRQEEAHSDNDRLQTLEKVVAQRNTLQSG